MNQELLEKRYLQPDEYNWAELVGRVTSHGVDSKKDQELWDRVYDSIHDLDFVPSRMPYMGTERPFASSCFVMPLEDDLDSIFKTQYDAVKVQRYGGGTGYNFSNLRPENDLISTTGGVASGPVAFMKMFDSTMTCIKRANQKHAAQMAILDVSHPDIEKFITCKDDDNTLNTFNISVSVSDEFMEAVQNGDSWHLKFNGKVYDTVIAKDLWDKLCSHAWGNGDPGVMFWDTVQSKNPFPVPVICSNPCGEIWLPAYASCNLGAINLSNMVNELGGVDYIKLEKTVRVGIRFLDASLKNAWFPLEESYVAANEYKNIGLGVMGWADALLKMGIAYNSDDAVKLALKLSKYIQNIAESESASIYGKKGVNVTLTSIAPTGSISMLAGCSSGIEPVFSWNTNKKTNVGDFIEVHPLAEEYGYPENKLPDYFVTTMDVSPEWHIEHQAAWQTHIDQSVSKTINMPNSATVDDVSSAYMLAWKSGCKSITVYRDGSRGFQVLNDVSPNMDDGKCPECKSSNVKIEPRCTTCFDCGYSGCDI